MTVETGFHDNRLPRHLADAVMEGPPRPQTSREHIKRIRLTCAPVQLRVPLSFEFVLLCL